MLDAVIGTLEMQGLWPLPPSFIRIVSVGSFCLLIQSLRLVSDWGVRRRVQVLCPHSATRGAGRRLRFQRCSWWLDSASLSLQQREFFSKSREGSQIITIYKLVNNCHNWVPGFLPFSGWEHWSLAKAPCLNYGMNQASLTQACSVGHYLDHCLDKCNDANNVPLAKPPTLQPLLWLIRTGSPGSQRCMLILVLLFLEEDGFLD